MKILSTDIKIIYYITPKLNILYYDIENLVILQNPNLREL